MAKKMCFPKEIVFKFFQIVFLVILYGCGNSQQQTIMSSETDDTKLQGKNYLSMKINGQEWIADRDIFGAFHPKGYKNAILIAGSKGKKDKNEQTLNINLFNANGAGTFVFSNSNKDLSVAQIGNLSTDNYICGSMMGFEMKVIVTKASSTPDVVEATFEGKMTCPTGEIQTITDGKFYYNENNF
jgi:hypothetical protein